MTRIACVAVVLWAAAAVVAGQVASPQQAGTGPAVQNLVHAAAKARDGGRIPEMKALIDQAAKLVGDDVGQRRFFAAALLDSGFHVLAIQVCEQTLARSPGDVGLHGLLGIALTRNAEYAKAIPHLNAAIRGEPRERRWIVHLARAQLFCNQEAAALETIGKAAELAPGDVEVLGVRAECEYRTMRLAACEKTCAELLGADPKSLLGWQLLIRTRRSQGRIDEAIATAADAVKAVGPNGDILLERGIALLHADRAADAVADLTAAAASLPADPRPQLHLCKAYKKLGMAEKAAEAKRLWLELERAPKKGR